MRPLRSGGWFNRRRFLKDDMCIGSTHPERTDARATRRAGHGPVGQGTVHIERAPRKIDLWVGGIKMKTGGKQLVCKRQYRFDQTGDPGGCVEMADIRLHRPQSAKTFFLSMSPEGMCESRDLNR